MTSMIGFCGGHHIHPVTHRIHHHHNHSLSPVAVGTIIGYTVGNIIANTVVNRIWIPEQKIITGYDRYNNPIYTIIPGHWEYR